MESNNTKLIRHLYDITHSVPESPTLSSMYYSKLNKVSMKKNILLPTQITNGSKFCSHCNTVFIPGVNLKMRIIYSKSHKKKGKKTGVQLDKSIKKDWKPRDRKLRYTCLVCMKSSEYELLKPTSKESEVIKKEPFVASWNKRSISPNVENGDVNTSNKNNAKERAKKRKKNTLSNLLNNKKVSDDNEKKTSGLLSLENFMKS